jgi:dihydroneopterin aldolase/2-amino-4-hydroxy-6-hydroxymethyldihydropteridine diphosphokinase
MPRAFIAIGSNIEPEQNVRRALRLLARAVRVDAVSTVYRTAALGRAEQPDFYNCVAAIETERPPRELKREVLRRIEQQLGRTRTEDKHAARTIDLDLIVYDDVAQADGDVALPEPGIETRPFLAIALHELAPDLTLPGSGRRIADIAAALADQPMERLPEYSARLRREVAHG